ncbi:MAG: aminopeptidase [Ruminococcaceae bacterium]|nr:aminopeptidase [Oscillospiraceae bacterium]
MAEFNKELEVKRESSWVSMDETIRKETFDVCERYKDFLNKGKTEREVVENTISILKANGFVDFNDILSGKIENVPGTKAYYSNRGRALFISVTGKKTPEEGFKIVGSHIDAPRLDIRPNPLYEDGDLALLKTHYYGGVKKYQWVATPLALHGVIIKNDGTKLNVKIGDEQGDPCFVISDLLPHLGGEQLNRPGRDVINAEQLNLIIGSVAGYEDPRNEDDKALTVKQNILTLLNEKYGICEKDFMRAELQVVPAAMACDVGFDRGLIGSYGHDDRICAYTSLEAILNIKEVPEHTAVAYFADKEEVGSMGNTGARSCALEHYISDFCSLYYDNKVCYMKEKCLRKSRLLSADVTAAYDPTFPEVFERLNAAYAGRGIAVCKYTGHGGKSGTSDACAEFVYEVTSSFDSEGIKWQETEMGKIDAGGGGTIGQFMANKGIEVLDCGVALFSMHAPYELASKADIYWTYRAYKNFFTTK